MTVQGTVWFSLMTVAETDQSKHLHYYIDFIMVYLTLSRDRGNKWTDFISPGIASPLISVYIMNNPKSIYLI